MIGLSFDKLPHYIYSNHRQFHTHEHHIDRIFNEDVLILMRKGILRFSEDNEPVELHANEYYLQRAGLHQTGILESEKPNYFFIHFNGTFEENGNLPLRGTFQSKSIQPLLDEMMLLGLESPKIEYERLFYTLLSELAKQQRGETMAEKIRSYLLQNYTNPISLQDISDHCCFLSKNSIVNIFKKTYGKTPYRYLTDYRLDRASEYLVSTQRSLSTIAFDVGFGDYTVFYRAFVEKYGISPKDYRAIKQAEFFIPPENERPKS
ncbi:MAG: helix-turn-helix transcriptional regulator [Tyzzerella sp.]|nr:helix-turn-helix transcriptional regulator [Tyzzerella sp.]